MEKFLTKAQKLDNVRYDIRGKLNQEAGKMADEGIEILKLNIGNPTPFGFKAPDELVKLMGENLNTYQGYTDSKGLIDARHAIVDYCEEKNIKGVTPNDVFIGNGVSELITMSMQCLLNQGDEVLVPAPDYPLWTASINLAGGKAVHYICDEANEWNPSVEDIRSRITDKTKAIVVINPNNPTGALYSKEILLEIVQIAREHQLAIFADEIYDRLVMDELEHISLASLADDVFFVSFNGLSKSHMMCGYRVGWMCLSGDKTLAKGFIEGLELMSSMRLCSNAPAQSIVIAALANREYTKSLLVPGGRVYEQREYVYNALNSIDGVTAVKPKAAFYIFAKLDTEKFNITNDEQFSLDLLHEKHILMTNGRGFNWPEPDHVRVVYLPCVEDLKVACENLKDFLETYKQK